VSGCGFADEQAGAAAHRRVVGSQIWGAVQLPGVQSVTPASPVPPSVIIIAALHLPVIVSHVEPDGQSLLAVHLAPQIFVAGWHTWPAEPRSHSASVAHWQNARMPASLPAMRPSKLAQVLAESGQSTAAVQAVTQRRSTGWQASLVAHCESAVHVVGIIMFVSPHPAKPSAKPAAVAATSQRLVFFIMWNVSLVMR
jgi:hypothetical protein